MIILDQGGQVRGVGDDGGDAHLSQDPAGCDGGQADGQE